MCLASPRDSWGSTTAGEARRCPPGAFLGWHPVLTPRPSRCSLTQHCFQKPLWFHGLCPTQWTHPSERQWLPLSHGHLGLPCLPPTAPPHPVGLVHCLLQQPCLLALSTGDAHCSCREHPAGSARQTQGFPPPPGPQRAASCSFAEGLRHGVHVTSCHSHKPQASWCRAELPSLRPLQHPPSTPHPLSLRSQWGAQAGEGIS